MSGENQNTDPDAVVDDESAQLLADLEKQDQSSKETKAPVVEKKAAPKKKAVKKKAAPKKTAAAAQESDVVADKQPDAEAQTLGRTITNTSKNPRRIGGVTVPVDGEYELTDQDLDDSLLMQKIDHSIAMGVLSRGAD